MDANIDQLTLLVERLKKTFHDASLIASEDIQDVDVSALIARILDGFEPLIAQRHGQFERAISPDLHLDTDSRLFSQVLSNLLSNAIKAIEPEGTVRVALAREGKNLILIVADNGVGIDPQALPHIFDRFYRVDSSRNRKVGGQGLGLAITKSIVQQLGGRIEVASRVGKGTTFRVLFQVDFFHHSVQPRESIASRS